MISDERFDELVKRAWQMAKNLDHATNAENDVEMFKAILPLLIANQEAEMEEMKREAVSNQDTFTAFCGKLAHNPDEAEVIRNAERFGGTDEPKFSEKHPLLKRRMLP